MLSTAPGERPGAVTLLGVSDDPDRARVLQGLGRALRRPWRLNEATRLSLDSLAERYAAERGRGHQVAGETPPATWFLQTVVPAKSHSFLRGALGGGVEGVLFYAERAIPVKRGQVMEGWTVALPRRGLRRGPRAPRAAVHRRVHRVAQRPAVAGDRRAGHAL